MQNFNKTGGFFSLCCGSNYSVAKKFPTSLFKRNRGIAIWFGKASPKEIPANQTFEVVNTKNGPVSILLRLPNV